MQTFIVVMVLLVVVGTLFDVVHKGSAKYFFANMRNSKSKAAKELGGGDLVGIAVQTAVVDVMTSGEFCNQKRRIAHLLTMYGFIFYLLATVMMVFCYPGTATQAPAWVSQLWWLGGLMV